MKMFVYPGAGHQPLPWVAESVSSQEEAELIVAPTEVGIRLARASPIPVLLVPAVTRDRELRTALVPLDGSPFAEAALVLARAFPRVILVRATEIPVFVRRDLLDREVVQEELGEEELYLRRVAESLVGCEVVCRAIDAMPDEAILAAEDEADVIVMATHGRSGLSRMLLGSVAEKVARSASCPVLLVNPDR